MKVTSMKKLSMKKIILAAGTLALLTGASAFAATQDPIDYRRTLFVPMDEDMIMLEAPRNMCFLDSSKYLEGSIFKLMSDLEKKKGTGVLLGAFAPCDGIANIGNADPSDGAISSGSVIWMKPSVGTKTPLERNDYLDTHEVTFKDDVRKEIADETSMIKKENKGKDDAIKAPDVGLDDYIFDDKARRTENGLSIGFTHDIEMAVEKIRTISVVAETSVRHYPIKVVLHINTKTDKMDLDETHALVDKFLAQQIALNE